MLKISRRSWHYRLQRYIFSAWTSGIEVLPPPIGHNARKNPPVWDLCRYFWFTVLMCFSFPFLVLFGVLLGVFFVLAVIFYYAVFTPWMKFVRTAAATALSLRRASSRAAAREPGLIKSYIKARKQRVCPMIEIVE